MVLYAARGSPSHAALRKRGAEALHDVPLVTSSLDAPGARPGGGKLRDRFRTVWEIHSLDLRVEVVRAGLAVGYLPDSVVRAAGHRRDFLPVDWLDFGVILRDVGLFHLEKHPLGDLAAELLRLSRPV
jgi:DNA-binding transcriptional LysR family regulator